jgi:hypothetical protein
VHDPAGRGGDIALTGHETLTRLSLRIVRALEERQPPPNADHTVQGTEGLVMHEPTVGAPEGTQAVAPILAHADRLVIRTPVPVAFRERGMAVLRYVLPGTGLRREIRLGAPGIECVQDRAAAGRIAVALEAAAIRIDDDSTLPAGGRAFLGLVSGARAVDLAGLWLVLTGSDRTGKA